MKQTFETTIQDVTVYPDRARVTRLGSAEITTKTEQLIIDNLPLSLNIDSVRVGGRGTARVRILGVDVQQHHYRETPAERVRELQAEIESLNGDLQAINDDKQGLQTELTYLSGLSAQTEQFARGLALRRTDVESQGALLDFVQQRDSTARTKVRELDTREHEVKKSLAQVQAQLKQLQSQQQTKRYRALVDVEVVGDGEFSAELTYVVNRAGWQPLYDVRLDESNNKIMLTALAQVSQKSGENWEGVGLTFSTARPALNQRLPKLHPIYVDEFKPRPVRSRAAKMTRAGSVAADVEEVAFAVAAAPAEAPPVVEAEAVVASVESTGAAVSFRASGSIDIPGDGSTRKTTLAEYPLGPQNRLCQHPQTY